MKRGYYHMEQKIAVLIPCYNEGLTIEKVGQRLQVGAS